MATHSCSFLRGKNWHTYTYLENRLLETSRFITLTPSNLCTWSENLADLLILTGSAVDTFFRDMRLCPNVSTCKEVIDVEKRVKEEKRKNWDVGDFMEAYEPLYELSKNEVTLPFGLSDSWAIRPFEDFGSKPPAWWIAYNHVKHEYYEKIAEANLGNVVNALGGLMVLNALHKDSQGYLVNMKVLKCGTLALGYVLNILGRSFIGYPKTMPALECRIETPIFVFNMREDPSK